MDIRIGVTQAPKELQVELGDDADRDKLMAQVESALAGEATVLWVTDRRGRKVGVPSAKIAYVEIGSPDEGRHVGFGTR